MFNYKLQSEINSHFVDALQTSHVGNGIVSNIDVILYFYVSHTRTLIESRTRKFMQTSYIMTGTHWNICVNIYYSVSNIRTLIESNIDDRRINKLWMLALLYLRSRRLSNRTFTWNQLEIERYSICFSNNDLQLF